MASVSSFEEYHVDQTLTLVVIPGPETESEAKKAMTQAAEADERKQEPDKKASDDIASTVDALSLQESPAPTPTPFPSPSPSTIQVRSRKLVQPRTLSCCIVVDVVGDNRLSEDLPSILFLKLYDRRFADQLRRNFGAEPWTQEVEASYINAVESGAAAQFLHDLETIPDFPYDTGDEDDWNSWQIEAFLGDKMDQLYEAETRAYDRLAAVQGKQVPRLIARVNLALSTDTSTDNAANMPPIKGILLQYIDGFPLRQVHKHAPQSTWQGIVDQAVAAVRAANDCEIMNQDVRLSNFVVEKTSDDDKDGEYKAYMFDFSLSYVRTSETDHEWATEKIGMDEDGAVGLIMKKILAQETDGFELQYEDSKRYWRDAGFDEAEL